MERRRNNDQSEPPRTIFLTTCISGGFGGGVEPARLNPDRKKFTGNPPKIDFSDADDDDYSVEPVPLPMIIAVKIRDFTVRRVLVSTASCADILYWSTFQKLEIPTSMLKPYYGHLEDVFGIKTEIKGYVDLKTTFGEGENADSINIRFLVTDPEFHPYNIVIGTRTLLELGGGTFSFAHLTMKYPRPDGRVGVIKVDRETARKCVNQGL